MQLPIHSSNKFDYSNKKFIAEISELGSPVFGSVYNDACDFGFSIKSEVTGAIKTFRIKEMKYDNEGDIQVWILEPLNMALRNMGIEVHLLND